MRRHSRRTSTVSPEWYAHYIRLQHIENAVRNWDGGVHVLQEQVTTMAEQLSDRELEATVLLNSLGRYFADMAKLLDGTSPEVHFES